MEKQEMLDVNGFKINCYVSDLSSAIDKKLNDFFDRYLLNTESRCNKLLSSCKYDRMPEHNKQVVVQTLRTTYGDDSAPSFKTSLKSSLSSLRSMMEILKGEENVGSEEYIEKFYREGSPRIFDDEGKNYTVGDFINKVYGVNIVDLVQNKINSIEKRLLSDFGVSVTNERFLCKKLRQQAVLESNKIKFDSSNFQISIEETDIAKFVNGRIEDMFNRIYGVGKYNKNSRTFKIMNCIKYNAEPIKNKCEIEKVLSEYNVKDIGSLCELINILEGMKSGYEKYRVEDGGRNTFSLDYFFKIHGVDILSIVREKLNTLNKQVSFVGKHSSDNFFGFRKIGTTSVEQHENLSKSIDSRIDVLFDNNGYDKNSRMYRLLSAIKYKKSSQENKDAVKSILSEYGESDIERLKSIINLVDGKEGNMRVLDDIGYVYTLRNFFNGIHSVDIVSLIQERIGALQQQINDRASRTRPQAQLPNIRGGGIGVSVYNPRGQAYEGYNRQGVRIEYKGMGNIDSIGALMLTRPMDKWNDPFIWNGVSITADELYTFTRMSMNGGKLYLKKVQSENILLKQMHQNDARQPEPNRIEPTREELYNRNKDKAAIGLVNSYGNYRDMWTHYIVSFFKFQESEKDKKNFELLCMKVCTAMKVMDKGDSNKGLDMIKEAINPKNKNHRFSKEAVIGILEYFGDTGEERDMRGGIEIAIDKKLGIKFGTVMYNSLLELRKEIEKDEKENTTAKLPAITTTQTTSNQHLISSRRIGAIGASRDSNEQGRVIDLPHLHQQLNSIKS
ncbi:MAG: hypothetical protein LBC92_05130 [Rickettsiales bacterium]|jgi:hypothetical protein|nr:hypothetical protein [Rickettsiales bacterium]